MNPAKLAQKPPSKSKRKSPPKTKFRLMAETIQDVFWMSTPGVKQMVYVSPAYEAIWGRTRESLYRSPHSFLESIHPEDRERVRAGLEAHAQGSWDFEYRIIRPDGSVRWIRDRGFPIRNAAGELELMTGVASDITELRHTKKALRESKEQFRLTFEGAPIGMAIADMDYRLRRVNKSFCEMLGYRKEELIGRALHDIIHPEDVEKGVEWTRKLFQGEIPGFQLEKRYVTKGGEVIWVSLTAALVRDQSGQPLYRLAMMENVTERKKSEAVLARAQAELEQRVRERTARLEAANRDLLTQIVERSRVGQALRESEERLRLLLETTRAVPWEADAQTWQFIYVGPQAAELLGYPVEQWYEPDFWSSHIHPEDRDYALGFCRQASQASSNYEFEYRMLSADGRTVWLHDLVSVEFRNGRPHTLRGFMIDTSERKEAQRLQAKLAGQLLSAQEEERRRLARELHDDLSQRLGALSIEAGKLEQQLGSGADGVRRTVSRMRQQLVELAGNVHGLSRQLHPAILDDLGLVAAIESECARFSHREGIQVQFTPQNLPDGISKKVSLCLYRITQEGLRNIAKHARAREAEVTLSAGDGHLWLSIHDSGIGFDAAAARGKGGLGLASMEERVRLVRGKLTVRSQPGQGTTVRVRVPLRRGASETTARVAGR